MGSYDVSSILTLPNMVFLNHGLVLSVYGLIVILITVVLLVVVYLLNKQLGINVIISEDNFQLFLYVLLHRNIRTLKKWFPRKQKRNGC